MGKYAIIIPYFGEWPAWFDLYLFSLKKNPILDVIFYTDISIDNINNIPANAIFNTISFKEYCDKVSDKLNIKFRPQNPYKLCDVRPFFPIIHADVLKTYEYIGWGDIDLIYGNLEKFFPFEKVSKYKIISTHADRFSGHLTLLKNSEEVCNKILSLHNWQELLEDNINHFGLDEIHLTRLHTPYLTLARALYLLSGSYFSKWGGGVKSWVLGHYSSLLYPKYHLRELFTTPRPPLSIYQYKNGTILDSQNYEIPYLHFLFFKKTKFLPNYNDYWKEGFYNSNSIDFSKSIIIDAKGIRNS